ncbi:hypothetical protein NEUTE2DRAFT_57882, partial [Neurospora tetrasperma FGSC 2509]
WYLDRYRQNRRAFLATMWGPWHHDLWCGIFDCHDTFGPRTSLSEVIGVSINSSPD